MDTSGFVPPPLPPWTHDRHVAALHDALAHVMADALSLTALASFAYWNTVDSVHESFSAVLRGRVAAGRRGQDVIARRMRALGGPVMLHPTDPSEVPRWMLAGQSADPLSETVLLAAGTQEFVRSIEATVEVAREVPDRACMRVMSRMQRNETNACIRLQELASAIAESTIVSRPSAH